MATKPLPVLLYTLYLRGCIVSVPLSNCYHWEGWHIFWPHSTLFHYCSADDIVTLTDGVCRTQWTVQCTCQKNCRTL